MPMDLKQTRRHLMRDVVCTINEGMKHVRAEDPGFAKTASEQDCWGDGKWKMASFMDKKSREYLYDVIYHHEEDWRKPMIIFNLSPETRFVDIALIPTYLQRYQAMTLIGGDTKDYYNTALKRRGIQTPWKRVKQCWRCNAPNSESVPLRVCKGCRTARFCSRKCQKAAWKAMHRSICLNIAGRFQYC